jgi:hypothetical protein
MAGTRWIRSAGWVFLALGLVACESEQAHYFQRRVNHASQDAVVRRWGPPHRVHELSNGDVVWAYESGSRSTAPPTSCGSIGRRSCATGTKGPAELFPRRPTGGRDAEADRGCAPGTRIVTARACN